MKNSETVFGTKNLLSFLKISVFCLLIATLPVYGQKAISDEASDKEKLRYITEVLWKKAYRDQDAILLDRLLAKEFIFMRPDGGVSTKTDQMEFLKKTKPTYKSFNYSVKRLNIFENGSAVVSGKGTVIARDAKGEYEYTFFSSNVLIKRNGIWKAVSSHDSGYKKTYIAKEK